LDDELTRPGEQPVPDAKAGGFAWASLALYVMGVLTGVLLFAIFSLLSGRGPFARVDKVAAAPAAVTADGVDMRAAAREGTLDAIATLEARANIPPTPAATPTDVPVTAFAVREANRLGNTDAPVVMVEYSDFQ
jgi:hypothetical protein